MFVRGASPSRGYFEGSFIRTHNLVLDEIGPEPWLLLESLFSLSNLPEPLRRHQQNSSAHPVSPRLGNAIREWGKVQEDGPTKEPARRELPEVRWDNFLPAQDFARAAVATHSKAVWANDLKKQDGIRKGCVWLRPEAREQDHSRAGAVPDGDDQGNSSPASENACDGASETSTAPSEATGKEARAAASTTRALAFLSPPTRSMRSTSWLQRSHRHRRRVGGGAGGVPRA